jgi:hypothetical protein
VAFKSVLKGRSGGGNILKTEHGFGGKPTYSSILLSRAEKGLVFPQSALRKCSVLGCDRTDFRNQM